MTALIDFPRSCSLQFLGRGVRLAQVCIVGDAAELVGYGRVVTEPVRRSVEGDDDGAVEESVE